LLAAGVINYKSLLEQLIVNICSSKMMMMMMMMQRASCAVTAVGLQRQKPKMFSDNPYIENTPSPSVDIKGIAFHVYTT